MNVIKVFCVLLSTLINLSFAASITNCNFIDFNLAYLTVSLSCVDYNGPYQLYRCFDVNFIRKFYGKKVHELRSGDCRGDRLNNTLPIIFSNLIAYDISYYGVNQLSADELNFRNLKRFNASHNELTEITSEMFKNTPNMAELDFSFNKIEILKSETFSRLTELEMLDLKNNLIQTINEHWFWFKSNKKLKELRLEHNPIQRFDKNLLWLLLHLPSVLITTSSEHLKELDTSCLEQKLDIDCQSADHDVVFRVAENELKFSKNDIEGLIYLNISGNCLQNVPEVIELLGSSIETLDLSSNFVGNLSENSFNKFDNLKHLNLRNTNLPINSVELFQHFPFVGKLESIYLENNPIDRLNCDTFSLLMNSSVEIAISCNEIEEINSSCMGKALEIDLNPNEVIFYDLNTDSVLRCMGKAFQQLKVLNISGNQLENTKEIIELIGSSIEMLDVSSNFIENFTSFNVASNEQFSNLLRLNLSQMNLRFINFTTTPIAWMLKELDLSFNQLQTLTFDGVFLHLIKLDASHNELKEISSFDRMVKVEEINFSFNEILIVNSEAFSRLHELRFLDLRNNLIQRIDESFIAHNRKLQELHLENNPIQRIDCNAFSSLIDVIKKRNLCDHIVEIDLSCFGNDLKIDLNSETQVHFRGLHGNFTFSCPKENIQKMISLNISGNHLQNVPEILELLGMNLKTLDVSSNFIGKLNAKTLEQFFDLEILNMSQTNLSNFGFETFYNQRKLKVLDLSHNRMKSVNFTLLLRNFKELNTLKLEGNDLIELETVTPTIFPKLSSLGISMNQFSCDYLANFLLQWSNLNLISNPSNQTHIDGIDCYHWKQEFLVTSEVVNESTEGVDSGGKSKDDEISTVKIETSTHRLGGVTESDSMGKSSNFDENSKSEAVDPDETMLDKKIDSNVDLANEINVAKGKETDYANAAGFPNHYLIEIRIVEIILMLCAIGCLYLLVRSKFNKRMRQSRNFGTMERNVTYRPDGHNGRNSTELIEQSNIIE